MKRIFYGWYMVAAGSGLQFLQAGLMTQAFGAYVAVLQEERGWSKTALSGAAALQQMEVAILGPILGWFIDRFGPQGVIRVGVLVFGCGLMLLSRTDSLPSFYAAFIVIAVGLPLAFVIRRRPEDHGETMDGVPHEPASEKSVLEKENLENTRDFT